MQVYEDMIDKKVLDDMYVVDDLNDDMVGTHSYYLPDEGDAVSYAKDWAKDCRNGEKITVSTATWVEKNEQYEYIGTVYEINTATGEVNDYRKPAEVATLKSLRHEAGMTQKQIADTLGIPLRTWESWEAGKRKPSEWVRKLLFSKLVSMIRLQEELDKPIIELRYDEDDDIHFTDLQAAKHYYLTWGLLKDCVEDPEVEADEIINEIDRMAAIVDAKDLEELADVLNEYKWVSGDSGDWFTCEY